ERAQGTQMRIVQGEDEIHAFEIRAVELRRLCPERSRPLSAMISSARWSAPPPTCQSPVPADSITTFSRPARSKASRSITSPIGERQIFPVHTTLIVYGEAIPYSQHISARCAPPRVPGVTPRRLFPHR